MRVGARALFSFVVIRRNRVGVGEKVLLSLLFLFGELASVVGIILVGVGRFSGVAVVGGQVGHVVLVFFHVRTRLIT